MFFFKPVIPAILFIIFSMVYLAKTSQAAEDPVVDTSWIHAEPEDFHAIEKMFLDGDCSFIRLKGYIYNTSSQSWLSGDKAIAAYPQLRYALAEQECDIQIDKVQLSQLLDLNFTGIQGPVLIYFDWAQSDNGTTMKQIVSDEFIEQAQKRFERASKDQQLPKFLVATPWNYGKS